MTQGVERMVSKGIRVLSIVALYYIGSAGVAQADTVPLPSGAGATAGGTALVGSVTLNPDGSYALAGQQQGGTAPEGGPVWGLQWNMVLNPDPSISGTLTLDNLTTTTRNFNLQFTLPVSPAFSPSLFGGSIAVTAIDRNNDSVLALTPNLAQSPSIYRGRIDTSTVLSLFAASLQCLPSGPGCTATSDESVGLPGPTIPGPGVASSIALWLNFTLTPGDRAVFDVNFTVEPTAPVPLPAALPLLLAGLGGLGVLRRRRTK